MKSKAIAEAPLTPEDVRKILSICSPRGLLVGGILVFLAIAGLIAIGAEWAADGFGTLGRAYETALLATVLGLGIQVIFGAFFLALLARLLIRLGDVGRH